jgi:hypothetical protein
MADVVLVDAFREQTFAAALPSVREYRPTAFRPHPRAKAVLALTRPFRWLVSAFHKTEETLEAI